MLLNCSSIEKSFVISNLQMAIYMDTTKIHQSLLYFINKGVVKVTIAKIEYERSNYLKDQKAEQHEGKEVTRTALLKEGNYFGEVALITRLKRTASVKAIKHCTLSTMSRQVLNDAKREYPQIFLSLRSQINVYDDQKKAKAVGVYDDFDFKFRRKMILNIPYLKSITPEIVQDIICLMRPRRFDAGTTIVKRGDKVDCIMLLKSGIIDVQVPVFQQRTHHRRNSSFVSSLSSGIVSEISSQRGPNDFQDLSQLQMEREEDLDKIQPTEDGQLVDFVAKIDVIIEYIQIKDLQKLQREYLQLNDILTRLDIDIEGDQMTDLDFFRFKRTLKAPMPDHIRREIRLKFRATVIDFYRKFKKGEAQRLPALEALRAFQEYKKAKSKEYMALKLFIDSEVNAREAANREKQESQRGDLASIQSEAVEDEDAENAPVDAYTELQNFKKQHAQKMQVGRNPSSHSIADAEEDSPALPLAGEHMDQVQGTMNKLLQQMQLQNEKMRKFTAELKLNSNPQKSSYQSAIGVLSKAKKAMQSLDPYDDQKVGRKSVLSEQEKPTALAANKIFEQPSSEGYDLGPGGFDAPQSDIMAPGSASIIKGAGSEAGGNQVNASVPMFQKPRTQDYVPPKSQTDGKKVRTKIINDTGSRTHIRQSATSIPQAAEELVAGKPKPKDDLLSDYAPNVVGSQVLPKAMPSAPADVVVDHAINGEQADSIESSSEEEQAEQQRVEANRDKSAAEMQRERNRALLLQFMKQKSTNK